MPRFSRKSHVASGLVVGLTVGIGITVVAVAPTVAASAEDADYVVWRRTVGATAAGDFNHDGDVDAADYVIWQRQSASGSCLTSCDLKTTALWG